MPVIAVAPADRVPSGTPSCEADTESILAAIAQFPTVDVVLLTADEEARRAARSARLSLGQGRIGLAHHDEPVTVFFVMAAAAQLLPGNALGLVDAVLDDVRRSTTTIAQLSSVSSLERPTPSVTQHVAGLVPGARFVVDWRAGTVRQGDAPDLRPGVAVVTAGSDKAVPGEVAVPAGAPGRMELASDDGGRWGSSRWRETTVLHVTLEEIVSTALQAAGSARQPRCPSCQRVGAGRLCVFCQVGLSSQSPIDISNGAVA